ncbi:MAG: hypoxanthine phosphoribosyltransferase [Deltaproteobacteria bacterium]|nr:hypoxanthine phosphoribosyltransferase [Deltaproteobacteria bacterium]
MELEILIPRDTILSKVKELAGQISSDYMDHEPLLVGILNGAVFFFTDLIREMTIPLKIDFIRAASYGNGTSSRGSVQLTKGIEIPIQGKHVLLVEDIVDSGLTFTHIMQFLKKEEPASIKLCALIDKLERREKTVCIDYCGFQVDEGFLVGYGLDFNEQYRYLPDICVLKDPR